MDRVRWGVLGTARIATAHVIPAFQYAEHAVVLAIASRDLERAGAVARSLGLARAYGSYEELLADSEIDAVYIPLPNDLHVPWSIRALKAGKHVLCEKPIGLSVSEAHRLVDAARRYPNLKIMEAFMYRFHPQWQHTKEMVDSGAVGELRTIHSFFSYSNIDPSNIRNQPAHGGGGLMDIGCYNISYSRFVFGREPARVFGIAENDPVFNTDRLVSAVLDFGGRGGTATFTCSTQLASYQRVNIFGTIGRIEIEIPVNAPSDRPCRLWHEHDSSIDEVVFEPCNQFTLECEAFSRAVIGDRPVPTPLEDAVANMRIIEAILLSARDGGWVHISQERYGQASP
jgi:predicted dehydrogenase